MIDFKNLSPQHLYLVALSGGADSVALALMMLDEGLNVHALHCNFHLRGEESNRDEAFVTHFCHKHNIPLDVKHFDTISLAKEHGVSLEMEARQLRYDWFRERALDLDAEAICVAHHMDDQAETLLLNLIRGTGLQGLSAMHPERTIQGLKILRPLLNISKQEILSYLNSRGQDYVTDSTNLERDALRNKIRLDLMPMLKELNPSIASCLARTAENVRMELAENSTESHLHRWLSPLGFTRQQILDVYSHTQDTSLSRSGLLWHTTTHTLLLDRGQLILRLKDKDSNVLPRLIVESLNHLPKREDFFNKQQAFIDAKRINGELRLRRAQVGDRFRPYGMKQGSKLLSDFLTNRKVNLLDKQSQLVVIDSATDQIVWVVGQEIDDRYRVDSNTTEVVRLAVCSER
jgi:tRNA(Ile)-lysidine synthase